MIGVVVMHPVVVALYVLGFLILMIIIVSIVRMADDTRKIKEILIEMNNKLSDHTAANDHSASYPQTTDDLWVCKCGTRNYNTNTCTTCGAKKE